MHFPTTSPIQIVEFEYDRKAGSIYYPLFITFFRLKFLNLIFFSNLDLYFYY